MKNKIHLEIDVKKNPEVILLYEPGTCDNRGCITIKAKGYTALAAEVNKKNVKHDILNARL